VRRCPASDADSYEMPGLQSRGDAASGFLLCMRPKLEPGPSFEPALEHNADYGLSGTQLCGLGLVHSVTYESSNILGRS
jgi:hypothetical protein